MRRQQRDWDDLADVDPLWAVVSDPARRGGRWDLDEFLATGVGDVERVLRRARELERPRTWGRALDFGCGVGRVTRALAPHFQEVVGVDVSPRMVDHARRLHEGIRFEVNADPDLRQFESRSFDLVYSRLVLQHLARGRDALRYVEEFLRVAKPDGLVVFQLPTSVPRRADLRRRAYALLRTLGVSPRALHARGLTPMRVIGVERAEVERTVRAAGGTIGVAEPDDALAGVESRQYYVLPG
jgi:SAM-dependent methyltransferase